MSDRNSAAAFDPQALDFGVGTGPRTLRTGFLEQVSIRPDAPALWVKGKTWSYAELDHHARLWAQAITSTLSRRAHRVGVFGSRSFVSYVGTLAAMMCGATFVPLNKKFPTDRTQSMIEQAKLDAIIVDADCAPQLEAVLAGIDLPVLVSPNLDGASFKHLAQSVVGLSEMASMAPLPLNELPVIIPEQIAYLLFTSGSTGQPKGVPVTHGNAAQYMRVMSDRYGLGPNDRCSQTFDQTFDLSVFDLYMAWENGACVYALQGIDLLAPTKFINQHLLTVWFSVPSLPALLRKKNLLKPDSMPSLKWSLFCGEPLPKSTAEAWQAAAPNSIVENQYGPTELTIACFVHRWDPVRSPDLCVHEMVPIGQPYPGLAAIIVDDELQPVAAGESGELLVCGGQTSPGYWGRPQLTAERFVTLEVPGLETLRFYRTGDRVKRLPSGDYSYLGRTDHQIKVLGYRVELGEIESVLLKEPGVVQAIAVGWPVVDGTAEGIVAFVSGTGLNPEQMIANSRQSLPAYMVPSQVVLVDDMPLNSNGKIDRNVLASRLKVEDVARAA